MSGPLAGSTAVVTGASRGIGRAIALASSAKLLLENGGNDPLLVDDDVDPVWAASQAALGAFTNAGQLCTSVERIYLHKAIAKPFLEALCAEARSWNSDPQPLVDIRHRSFVHAQVSEALGSGATALVGGSVPDGRGVRASPRLTFEAHRAVGEPPSEEEETRLVVHPGLVPLARGRAVEGQAAPRHAVLAAP